MTRFTFKVVGAAGQGINSIGEIVSKGLKRAGYCVFGYREYPSLIKGGHCSYQIDVSGDEIRSTETKVDMLIALNHYGLALNLHELRERGVIVHQTPDWKFSEEEQASLQARSITVIFLPVDQILATLKAKSILGNVLMTAFVWKLLRQDPETLKQLVTEQFGHKKDLLDLNLRCIDEGMKEAEQYSDHLRLKLQKAKAKWKDHLLVTGSQAMGLGAVHAGVRLYAGYPMTPASPLLSFIAELQNETGMVIKQAEDEITAAQMVSGAMFMGTRALTATSGGGFDLMSETISLNAIIENPTVFVLAQRPGPATGLPTWTAQGDLLMAVFTSHGEFARCVLSVSDAADCFSLMSDAFNIAERYQISVIVLTDKQIAEALYTEKPFDQKETKIDRGLLVTDPKKLSKLKSSDRYNHEAKDGIAPRWLPGSDAATYCAQGDEHAPDGTVDETAENAKQQFDKRLRKQEALMKSLPEPELFVVQGGAILQAQGDKQHVDVLLVGWGSTKGPVLDVMEDLSPTPNPSPEGGGEPMSVGYLHYTYLWPLKTERFEELANKAKRVILVEGNALGQLGILLRQTCGREISERILKYDGRPYFVDELQSLLEQRLGSS